MSRKSDSRQKIIDVARELFWQNGYETTGVAEILQKAGIGSGSLYWFFKKKEDILVAVLDQYRRMLETMIAAPAYRQSGDPIERIFLILNFYRIFLMENDFKLGCPIGNVVIELGNKYEKVRQLTVMNFECWRGMIKKCLNDANDRLLPDSDHDDLSIYILTVIQGAVLQSRAYKDIVYFDKSIIQLRSHINSMLSDA
jgi:AcrR family transcriptional regulator